jgi:hypothetical protein
MQLIYASRALLLCICSSNKQKIKLKTLPDFAAQASPVNYSCTIVGSPPQQTAPTSSTARSTTPARAQWLLGSLNTVQNVFLNFSGQLNCHDTDAEMLLLPVAATGTGTVANTELSSSIRAPVPQGASSSSSASASSTARTEVGVGVGAGAGVGAGNSSLGDITRPWNYMAWCFVFVFVSPVFQ